MRTPKWAKKRGYDDKEVFKRKEITFSPEQWAWISALKPKNMCVSEFIDQLFSSSTPPEKQKWENH